MHDLVWFIVFGLILSTPFMPVLLRTRCPGCSRGKLENLDTVKAECPEEPSGFSYITIYKCSGCQNIFIRVKGGKLEPAGSDERKRELLELLHQ